MRTVLLVDPERIQEDALKGVQFTSMPKVGERVQVWIDDDHYREGKVVKVYGDSYDVGELGDVVVDKVTDALKGRQA